MPLKRAASIGELKEIARIFLQSHPQGGIIGLTGDLGSGKTTFVRSCIEIICETKRQNVPRVISPTFVIHQSYRSIKPSVDHFDLYRLEAASDLTLVDIGYFDALEWASRNRGFLFVEWPVRVADPELLELTNHLHFTLADNERILDFK